MTDRPILFSGPMVRALLDGRKTQTRRIMKPQPRANDRLRKRLDSRDFTAFRRHEPPIENWRCPYGGPGDRLWVKETHLGGSPGVANIIYRADGEVPGVRWRPSIHMPRRASRVTLAITDVRVERLQDISEADAIAEGLYRSIPDERDRDWFAAYTEEQTGSPPTPGEWKTFNAGVWMVPGVPQGWGLTPSERRRDTWGPTPQFCYRLLWEHINGPGSWGANPWVWAVTFEVERPS